jgi:hypothetical protein
MMLVGCELCKLSELSSCAVDERFTRGGAKKQPRVRVSGGGKTDARLRDGGENGDGEPVAAEHGEEIRRRWGTARS